MLLNPSGSYQEDLRDQQKDPGGKYGAVEVNEQVGQRSLEHPGQIIGAREPHKDYDQNKRRKA